MNYSLPTNISGLRLENPIIVASGILGLSQDIFNRLYKIGAGAIVTKSISLNPREGYRNPTIVPLEDNSFVNAVGLANPGSDSFSREISNNKIPLIVSLVGSRIEEFPLIIEKFAKVNILGFELNLSCPHVEKMGMEIGDDLNMVSQIVKTIKDHTKKPLFVKVGLGNSNILDVAKTSQNAGADGITAINTIRAMAIDIENTCPILENKIGGLSGRSIKPIGVRCVYELSKILKIPIIGCGGILNYKDVVEYIMAGATAVQVGSLIAIDGLNSLRKLTQELFMYMREKNYTISEIVGIAHRY